MKKSSLPMVLNTVTLLAITAASCRAGVVLEKSKLHNQAIKEALVPACPGVPGKVPFWNAHASRFMFAPAFDFKEVEGAADYRFILKPKNGDALSFRATQPWSALSPVWEKTPVGYIDLEVEALDSSQQVIGIAGRRSFYRAAVFNGPYHEPVMSYTESARRALEYLYRSSWLQHWLVDGTPDPTYSHYCYPSKIISAGINGMLRYGEMVPENKESVWKIARLAADHLIAASEPDGAPLAYFPPTYDSTHIRDDSSSAPLRCHLLVRQRGPQNRRHLSPPAGRSGILAPGHGYADRKRHRVQPCQFVRDPGVSGTLCNGLRRR